MEKVALTVNGMRCGHCKMAVESDLKEVAGVSAVAVDLAAKRVEITFDAALTNVDALKEVIVESGYSVE